MNLHHHLPFQPARFLVRNKLQHKVLIGILVIIVCLVLWQKPFYRGRIVPSGPGDTYATSEFNQLPLKFPDSMIAPMNKLLNVELQLKLEAIIHRNTTWSSLVKQKRMSVGFVDLRNPYNAKFARINGNQMMYAASLPKIGVLLASMDAIHKGTLKATPEVKRDMRLMISKSDNAATTRMMDRIGLDQIAEVMQDPEYKFYDINKGGGLWVGKRYAKTGPRHGDPLMNISHGATATQVCRYYYLLAYGHLINYQRSKEMLSYLVDPELHHKFVNTLDRVAPDAKVFRKSGTWKDYHADSVLVWGPDGRRYILVALVQDSNGEQIMRQLIKVIDEKLIASTES